MTSTSTHANPPPAFSIFSSGPESHPSVLTPELSSDCVYTKKGSNQRIVVINAASITHKKSQISEMAEYCDPDLKLDSSICSSALLTKGYVVEFRRDQKLNGGGVMIVTKDCYTITGLVLPTAIQNETELVWATITLKDYSKLVIGSFYRPLKNGSAQFWNWKINYPRLQTPLGTNPNLLLFWSLILTQGY